MVHQVIDENGHKLDASLDLDPDGMTLQSRGGISTKGGSTRNPDYGTALRLLLKRIAELQIPLEGVWVDSSRVQQIPVTNRLVLEGDELDGANTEKAFSLISSRMAKIGQQEGASGGNPTKKLRIQFREPLTVPLLESTLGLARVQSDTRARERLPAEELHRVSAVHLWNALEKLRTPGFKHPFGESVDFDLVTSEGERFPPKAVFGVAASEALGYPVLPKHFSGGEGTPCFQVLKRSGFEIVSKTDQLPPPIVPITEADRAWAEGRPRLVAHLKRERASGLSQAKREDFLSKHGKMFCERCGMDPVQVYGGVRGLACIEVHHHSTQVTDMGQDHKTRLEDLTCLCANCHRVVHYELRTSAIS